MEVLVAFLGDDSEPDESYTQSTVYTPILTEQKSAAAEPEVSGGSQVTTIADTLRLGTEFGNVRNDFGSFNGRKEAVENVAPFHRR